MLRFSDDESLEDVARQRWHKHNYQHVWKQPQCLKHALHLARSVEERDVLIMSFRRDDTMGVGSRSLHQLEHSLAHPCIPSIPRIYRYPPQDQGRTGTVSKVQWANGLKLVLQLDVPFLSYVVSFRETATKVVRMAMSVVQHIARHRITTEQFLLPTTSGQGGPRMDR